MKCPNCQTVEMLQKNHQNVDFEICPKCKGFWFDHNELKNVMNVAAKGMFIPEDAVESKRKCPECNINLHEFKYPQTYCYVDMCHQCGGLWFDAKELEEIKIVRESHQKKGELQEFAEAEKITQYAQPQRVKSSLLDFVNSSLSSLTDFSKW